METKNTSRIHSALIAVAAFLSELGEDPEFHVYANRAVCIGLVALFLGVGMFALARSGLIDGCNTLEVIAVMAFVSTMVFVSAIIGLTIRVMDELLSYIADRIE